ncbi:MAG: hypothetical protein RIQ47_590 [Bacteroidota bacterium]
MKKTVLILAGFLMAVAVQAQTSNVSTAPYPAYPGKDPANNIARNSADHAQIVISPEGTQRTISSCDCWVERDRGFQVAPFLNGTAPEYRNDDGSTDTITLVSPFCFYGTYYRKLFINNNGNISFGQPYATYSADSFPNTNFVMIAPFWADVDTRGPASGLVYYEQTNSHLIVQWDSVGYFNSYDDKRNAFQLVITDGLDPLLPAGYNVGFCYKNMEWTTGDASLGIGGFGGTPATVGVNQGNGINYIQMGRFDQPGNLYDGPGGLPDGIDFLDNQSFFFNTCVSNFNIAPVVSSQSACDTVVLCVGDSSTFSVSFLGPEPSQQITPTVNFGNLQDATITSLVSGSVGTAEVQVIATNNNLGFHTIQFLGQDNGTPSQTTTTRVVVRVIGAPTAQFLVYPDTGTTVYFDNYSLASTIGFWDFGDGTSGYAYFDTTHYYAAPGVYDVMLVSLTDEGCFTDTAYQTITVTFNTGVASISSQPFVQLVPNPSKGFLTISGKLTNELTLRLMDTSGRTVIDRSNVYAGQELDIRQLPAGIYFYSITTDDSQVLRTGKLVVE